MDLAPMDVTIVEEALTFTMRAVIDDEVSGPDAWRVVSRGMARWIEDQQSQGWIIDGAPVVSDQRDFMRMQTEVRAKVRMRRAVP